MNNTPTLRHPNYDADPAPAGAPHRRRWLLYGGLALFIPGIMFCGIAMNHWRTLPPFDAGQPAYFTLSAGNRSPGSVSGLSLRVTGLIDGEVDFSAGDRPVQKLSGTVDWEVHYDWFEPTCHLNCRPVGAATGELRISYQFH